MREVSGEFTCNRGVLGLNVGSVLRVCLVILCLLLGDLVLDGDVVSA